MKDKQRKFCEEYLVDLNSTRAAIRSGYSERTAAQIGYENLRKPELMAKIESLMAERSERCKVSSDYVIRVIQETIDRCSQANAVVDRTGAAVFNKDRHTGELRPLFEFDPGSVLRGAELLGRHLRMFSDRVELTGPAGGAVQLITAETDPATAARIYREMFGA